MQQNNRWLFQSCWFHQKLFRASWGHSENIIFFNLNGGRERQYLMEGEGLCKNHTFCTSVFCTHYFQYLLLPSHFKTLCDFHNLWWRRTVLIIREWGRAGFPAPACGSRCCRWGGGRCGGLGLPKWLFRIILKIILQLRARVLTQGVIFIQIFFLSAALRATDRDNKQLFSTDSSNVWGRTRVNNVGLTMMQFMHH